MINQRLEALRYLMREKRIAIYLVPTADFHESEYVGEYFKAREFMTGFTGSAGTAVITLEEAGLWTDARYFVQAAKQLEGSSISLYRMGEEGVPTILSYIKENLKEGENIGFDGRVINASLGRELEKIAKDKNGKILSDEDLVGQIWSDRPGLPEGKAWILEEKYSGESIKSKLSRVRREMEKKKADCHLLTSLYDIAWLLNLRGDDVNYVPVVLSYLAIEKDRCMWFVRESVLTGKVREYLEINSIEVRAYEDFYDYVAQIKESDMVLLDLEKVNDRIWRLLPNKRHLIDEMNPTEKMKAIKNPTEVGNIRNAHIKDAVAMCKFMYWLKTNVGKIPMTEISVSDYLESLRAEQDGYVELSFDTICGYAEHGAIVHYAATEQTDIPLKAKGLLLVDSGGHYLEGTTDITRTFALGEVSEEMKDDFTRVCRSNLNLSSVVFLYGCSGRNLDIVARTPLWEVNKDYKHGTGHGVGYLLNVHEGPNGFRWQKSSGKVQEVPLEEGMITTDEPGIYIEGKYGIRIENELLCRKGTKNEYGQFMYFEPITYVPIDRDALDPKQMSAEEIKCLNAYHEKVYEVVSPYLSGEELDFLRTYTSPLE